jgi:hypothetical protein
MLVRSQVKPREHSVVKDANDEDAFFSPEEDDVAAKLDAKHARDVGLRTADVRFLGEGLKARFELAEVMHHLRAPPPLARQASNRAKSLAGLLRNDEARCHVNSS